MFLEGVREGRHDVWIFSPRRIMMDLSRGISYYYALGLLGNVGMKEDPCSYLYPVRELGIAFPFPFPPFFGCTCA